MPGMTALYRDNANLLRRRCIPGMRYKSNGGPAAAGSGTITLTSPSAYQVFQRSGTTGTIYIAGTYTGTAGPMEASLNGGPYVRFCDQPSGGVFSGLLAGQPQGQGTLIVRWVGGGGAPVSVNYVGIGEVFILAGQSNNVGVADATLSYSHATLKAGDFNNDYAWNELVDPVDDNAGQVDAVSQDGTTMGHWALPMTSTFLAAMGIPVAWVPCALGGSPMVNWQPGADHFDRTTLYGSMAYRARSVGGCRAVLWWQGEDDAIRGTTEAQYNTWLDTLANAVMADLGVKLMPCKIEILDGGGWNASTTNVNNAIGTAWADNSNILTGPDFSAINWGGAHYGASTAVNTVAPAWWAAMRAAWGW